MKEGWVYKTVGELFETYAGGTPHKSHAEYYVGGTIPWLKSGEVCKKYITATESYITELGLKNSSAKYYPQNTVVVAMYGATAAQVGILKFETTSNQAVCGLLPNGKFLPEFVYYYFTNIKEDLAAQAQGGAQPNLSQVKIKKVLLPILSLSDQQRIVSYLDAEFAKIEALKANAEKQLQAAKDLFQAALKELLTPKEGWKIVNIGDVFKSYSGGTPNKSHKEYYNNATIPWLNSGEVCQKYITSTSNYISELGLKNSSAKFFPVNTVLIAMYGATAAQAGILKFEATSNQAICGLLPTKEILPEFVYYWFLYNKTEFASMAQGGAQPNLSQIKIKAMPIPKINLNQQKIICDKLEKLDEHVKALQTNYTETITLCNDLKQALLKKVFE